MTSIRDRWRAYATQQQAQALADVASGLGTDAEIAVEATARANAVNAEAAARSSADALSLLKSANLSDLANTAAARSSLGLGSAAQSASSDFDAAGAAAAAQAYAVQRAHHTGTQLLATISDAGTAASHPATDFDTAGAAASAQSAAQTHADTGDATHSAANPAHTAGAVSVTTSGLAVVTHTNVQAALADLDTWANGRPTHESGTLSALPANGSRNNGSTYLATDSNGGTTYRMVAGVWAQEAAGVNSVLGLVAGPVFLTTSFNVQAIANTMTDVPSMSIAVPASARPVCVRFKFSVNGNGGLSTSGTVLQCYVALADASNVNKAIQPVPFTSTGVNINQIKGDTVEFWLDVPVTAATYKVRAQTSAAIPTNWATMSLVPSGGLVGGARDALTATAY